jgi:hypothetical protein
MAAPEFVARFVCSSPLFVITAFRFCNHSNDSVTSPPPFFLLPSSSFLLPPSSWYDRSMPSWCLSVHVPWCCRHAGACCRTGWTIPVEAPAFERLRVHFGRSDQLFVTGGPLPEGAAAVLAADENGTCRFHEGQRCAIHRQLGPGAMPVACQQFPRQVLRDGRGTFITLSHYCPTAAALLLDSAPLTIVDAPSSLTLNGAVEGLDATSVLPPLLRPGLLTDLDGYGEWERQSIAVLGSDRWSADAAIGQIAAATGIVSSWAPGRASLKDAVAAAFDGASGAIRSAEAAAAQTFVVNTDDLTRYELAAHAVPPGLTAPQVPLYSNTATALGVSWTARHVRTVRAYLASRLFGNWIAYYASGLLTVVEYLRVCLAVFDQLLVEAIRQSDLLLAHLTDPRTLARSIEDDAHFRARTIPPLRHHRHAIG